jgi:BED zinc finger
MSEPSQPSQPPQPSQSPQETSQFQDVRKTKTYSEAWNYFNLQDPQNPLKIVCQKCNQKYSKSTGITTLKEHLKKSHGITIDNIKKAVQAKLNFSRVDPWPNEEKSIRDQALVEWVIVNLQPFSVVTNVQFIKLINTLDPRYILPGRASLKEKVTEYFDEMRRNIRLDIDKIPGKVSLTCDMWTSTLTNSSFLGLTIHYVNKDWQFKHFLLDIISFNERHTANNITDAILSVLNEFNLKEKILALTTDNATTMMSVGRLLTGRLEYEAINSTFGNYRCAAHIINLAAQQGLELIDDAILNVRHLMKKIKNSVILTDELKNLCKYANVKFLGPELDIKTRWNSTYNMLKKLEKMWSGLQMLAVQNREVQTLLPRETEWKIIKVRVVN